MPRLLQASRFPRLTSQRARDLILLGGLAFVLRLAWVIVYGRVQPPEGAVNDTTAYEFLSVALAHNSTYTGLDFQPTAGWPPGFPFVVSLLFRIFGVHLKLALCLNIVLATATVVLLYLVAERILGGRNRARIAAGLFAVLPGPLYFSGLFMSETLFMFMIVGFLALAVFMPDRTLTVVVLGVALGLAALTRGEGLLMPIIPLAMWWGHYPRRAWLKRSALLLVVMALTVAPWTIRNAVVLDEFVPVSNNASWTLWWGHNPQANGGRFLGQDTPSSATDRPRGTTETERAKELRHEAVEWALHNPLKELGLIPRKLIALNNGSGGSIPGWLNSGPRNQWQLGTSSIPVFTVLADAFGYFLLLTTLASVALVGARRLWRIHPGMQGVLAYLALCLVNYGFVYYGQYRYRIPMEPFMILVATPLLARLWEERHRWRADDPVERPADRRAAVPV